MPDSLQTVLGFDTSGPHCAVAVVRDGKCLIARTEAMAKGQAERLPPLVAEVLSEAGLVPGDICAIGVGTGPGNFTGTRIAVAFARGLASGLGIPAEGVGAVEALAAGRDVTVCLPAPRGQVHLGYGASIITQPPDAPIPEGLPDTICGPAARDVAAVSDRNILTDQNIAEGIAHIAAARAAPDRPRPAPIYLRAADAAPASDPPPRIL